MPTLVDKLFLIGVVLLISGLIGIIIQGVWVSLFNITITHSIETIQSCLFMMSIIGGIMAFMTIIFSKAGKS